MSAHALRCTSAPSSDAYPVLDDIQLDRRQSDAYGQWLALAERDRGTPLRSSFRPERSSVSMPAGMLLHIGHDGERISLRQKIEGRLVSLAFGEGNGKNLEDIYQTSFLARFMPRMLETVMTGTPAMVRDVVKTAHGTEFPFSRLILPFREDNGEISRLFIVFSFDPHAISKLDQPLPLRRETLTPSITFGAPEQRLYA